MEINIGLDLLYILLGLLSSTGYGVVMIKWWAPLVAICLCPFWVSHLSTWEGGGELGRSGDLIMERVYVQLF